VPLNLQRGLKPTRIPAQSNKLVKDRANIAVSLAAVYAHQLVPRIINISERAAFQCLTSAAPCQHHAFLARLISGQSSTALKKTTPSSCQSSTTGCTMSLKPSRWLAKAISDSITSPREAPSTKGRIEVRSTAKAYKLSSHPCGTLAGIRQSTAPFRRGLVFDYYLLVGPSFGRQDRLGHIYTIWGKKNVDNWIRRAPHPLSAPAIP